MGSDEVSDAAPEPPATGKENNAGRDLSERPKRGDDKDPATEPNHQPPAGAIDMETGKPMGPKDQVAILRSVESQRPMGYGARRRKSFRHLMGAPKKLRRHGSLDEDEEDNITMSMHGRLQVQASFMERHNGDEEQGGTCTAQYRLSAQHNDESMAAKIMGMVGISTGSSGLYDDAGGDDSGVKCCGVNPNRLVTKYLHWTFRSSIFLVLFSAALGFFSLTLFFALLIFWAGNNHPLCIHVNGYEFGADGARFSDAYALSWATFSTVGYGLIFPSTSAVTKGTHDCAGITTLCTLESFVGILFASFCGAIVFGKVARIRSHAQVTFSDPIVVRFGAGVDPHVLDDDSSSDEKDDDKLEKIRFLPFPVLEFRVINRLSAVKGGELMDATMNVVASIDECQANSSVRNAARGRRRKGKRWGVRPGARPAGRRQSLIQRAIVSSHAHPGIPEEKPFLSTRTISDSALTAPKTAGKVHQTFEEDPSGKLVPKRIFSKLELDTPDHPFFKRVWTVRHELDVHSPLLTNNARRMIRENNGHWPEELNNHAAVRASVQFDQILVSLSGTSNADANSVYAQKVYEYIDMNVGYRFANVLYRDPRDQSLFVDPTVLNDVLEQHGGGAEPLTVMHLPNLSGIFVT